MTTLSKFAKKNWKWHAFHKSERFHRFTFDLDLLHETWNLHPQKEPKESLQSWIFY